MQTVGMVARFCSVSLLSVLSLFSQSVDEARQMIRARNWEGALRVLDGAQSSDKQSAEWHGLRSQCLEMTDRPKEAVAEANEALTLEPNREERYVQLGRIFLRFRTPQAAVEVYTDALQRFPGSVAALLGRGLAYKDLQKTDAARADLVEVLRQSPGLALAFEGLAEAELQAKQFDNVISAAIAFRKDNAQDGRSYYYEAAARDALAPGDDMALKLADAAIRHSPSFAAAYVLRGRILVEQKRFSEALTALKKAEELRPGYSPVHLYLAKAYHGLGDDERAEAATGEWTKARDAENAPFITLSYHRVTHP